MVNNNIGESKIIVKETETRLVFTDTNFEDFHNYFYDLKNNKIKDNLQEEDNSYLYTT